MALQPLLPQPAGKTREKASLLPDATLDDMAFLFAYLKLKKKKRSKYFLIK
jgi:hypothetical protein